MKNLLFVIESLRHGGAEKSLVTLLNNIDLSNYNIDLLLFQKGGEFERLLSKNINIIYKKPIKYLLYSRLIFWFKSKINKTHHKSQLFWKSFNNQINFNTKKYDIAIAYNQGFSTYFVAEKVQSNKKYTWLNTDYQKAGYNPKFDLRYYNAFNQIICVSEESKVTFINSFKNLTLETPIDVIKDISDHLVINKKALEHQVSFVNDKVINILSVGRLVKAKGFNMAVEACSILHNKGYDIHWYIIGEGNMRGLLEKLITKFKLTDRFYLLGYKENPYPYIKKCDIYVQTSLFEGLGLTVIEASILKKPIVCTNFSTASKIINHNSTGLICEMTAKSIANSIIKYLDNPELTQKVISNLKKESNTDDKKKSLQKINQLFLL